jgi:hypothetical protein
MIQIENLVLKLPDMGEEEARRLGDDVAANINNLLPGGLNGQIDVLDIQLPAHTGMSRTELARLIAERIAEKIKYGNYDMSE